MGAILSAADLYLTVQSTEAIRRMEGQGYPGVHARSVDCLGVGALSPRRTGWWTAPPPLRRAAGLLCTGQGGMKKLLPGGAREELKACAVYANLTMSP